MSDQPPVNPYASTPQPMSPGDEKLWAALTHLVSMFLWAFPLFTYLLLRERGPFVRAQTATALNFMITLVIGYVVSWVLIWVVIGIFTLIAVGVVGIVFYIIAAMKAYRGEFYVIPVAIPFVK